MVLVFVLLDCRSLFRMEGSKVEIRTRITTGDGASQAGGLGGGHHDAPPSKGRREAECLEQGPTAEPESGFSSVWKTMLSKWRRIRMHE